MRVLVTITPLMYREATASSLQRSRPDFEVRIAASQDVEEEVLYSDGMDAKVIVGGRVEEVRDMPTQELLRVADRAVSMAR